ncbi:unnamed protein product [Camellia sinensis]
MEFIRKGPWTEEEDSTLVNYITIYGEGPWNSVAQCAGKSCRLRWLNYLRPDVRRGNLTLQEQFLILHLHLRWGNRWSKIAQQLPGRTDNEIKNYWRTRIQKQAKQLNCDVNSNEFRDTIRNFLLPRLVDQIQAESDALSSMAEPTSIHDSSATETWMIASSSQQQFLEKQSVFTDCDSDHALANIWLNISSLTDWGGCFGATGLTSDRNNACCEQDMFDDAEEEEEETMEYRKASQLAAGGGGGWGSVDTMLYYDGGEEGAHNFSVENFDERTVTLYDQCEKEYHVGCLRDSGLCDLKELPRDKWFCCDDYNRIHVALQNLVLVGAEMIPASVSYAIHRKHVEKGFTDGVSNDDVQWRILSRRSRYPDHLPVLSSREIYLGKNFGGMYCVILIVKSVVSVGLLRIFGRKVTELPLVATSGENQGKGYFQALFSCIESLLYSLNVENLVLPIAEEAESIWTKKLGFRKMSDERRDEVCTWT